MHKALSQAAFEEDVANLSQKLLDHRGWTLISSEYPVIDIVFGKGQPKALRLRFVCDNWPDQPPSVEGLSDSGEYLKQWPVVGNCIFNNPHPATGRPFICMRGSREFHTHENHRTESWENYRDQPGNSLQGLIEQLWHVWKGGL